MFRKYKAYISPDCGLSSAVLQVFELRASGYSGKEIANVLHKSKKSVDAQTTIYLKKLECDSTAEAIAKAVRESWITVIEISKTTAI